MPWARQPANNKLYGSLLRQVQGLERDEGLRAGSDEERAARHERQVPGLRDGDVPDS